MNAARTGDVGLSMGAASNLLPNSVDPLFRDLPKASTFPLSGEVQDMSTEHSNIHPSHRHLHRCPNHHHPWGRRVQAIATCFANVVSRSTLNQGKGGKPGRARWMLVVRWAVLTRQEALVVSGPKEKILPYDDRCD